MSALLSVEVYSKKVLPHTMADTSRDERTTSIISYVGEGSDRRCHRRWQLPVGTALRSRLILCHGTHEHSGRYEELATAFTSIGCEVFALDFCGHGRSEGERGDIGSLEGAIADVVALAVSAVPPLSASRPLVIFGHSLGSMLAFLAAHRLASDVTLPKPSAVILSGFAMDSVSPPFGFKSLIPVLRAMPSAIRAICAQLARIQPTGPACPLPPPEELTSFQERAAQKHHDPHVYHGWIQNRTALCLLDARSNCQRLLPVFGSLPSAAYPFLLVHGGADELCPRSACDALLAASAQPDKELQIFPGLLHEVCDSPEVRSNIVRWLDARTRPGSTANGPRSRL